MDFRIDVNGESVLHFGNEAFKEKKASLVEKVEEPEAYSYAYSGKHDHGILPELKKDNPFVDLVHFCQIARQEAGLCLEKHIDNTTVKDTNEDDFVEPKSKRSKKEKNKK